jgi:hypothetical protein
VRAPRRRIQGIGDPAREPSSATARDKNPARLTFGHVGFQLAAAHVLLEEGVEITLQRHRLHDDANSAAAPE